MKKHFSLWKTTLLGGVFFLLPLGVLVFLIGQAVNVIYLVAKPLQPYVAQWSPGGISLAVLLATALVLALCTAAGVVARRSVAARYTEQIEKLLMLLFPRYAIIKDRLAGNLGGDLARPHLKPVLVRLDDFSRLGFEVERSPAPPSGVGAAEATVTVYLPGAPDPWTGHVVHVAAERVTALSTEFADAVDLCETLGRRANTVLG